MCYLNALPSLRFQSTFYTAIRLFPVIRCVCVSLLRMLLLLPSRPPTRYLTSPQSLAGFCLSLQSSSRQDPLSSEAKHLLSRCSSFHSAFVLCLKSCLSSTSTLSGTFSRPSSELHLLDSVSCFYNSYYFPTQSFTKH